MNSSVGEQLRLARQERDITLEQIAQGTHIRLHYLQAMESGEFQQLPSKAHARGFTRAVAGYLGLDAELLLAVLDGEADKEDILPKPQVETIQAKPLPEDAAASAMSAIGQKLQQQREVLGFSLDDIERHTHIRRHYLVALEAGNLEGLPSPVQGRGMLSNYAAFLGMDPEPLLLKFADGLQARLAAAQAAYPKPKRVARQPARAFVIFQRWFSIDFLLGGFLVVSLAAFVIWGAIRITAMRTVEEADATVPSIAEALMPTPEPFLSPTPEPTVEPTAEDGAVAPLPTVAIAVEATGAGEVPVEEGTDITQEASVGDGTLEPASSGGSLQVYLTVHQRAWVRVVVDGEVVFEGRMLPGSAYAYDGSEQIEILTGNGAALQVFYNQRDLGRLGIYGEVVDRIFTLEGELLPTPTITPTPTATFTPAAPVEVTETPQPSPLP
jgi:cytoskeletal protein RodZ